MELVIPPFAECLAKAETRLSQRLQGKCFITVHRELSEELLTTIETIDHQKFRQELWYSRAELEHKKKLPGFLCLTARLNEEVIAFDYGYDDEEEKDTFYSDNTATLIEGKGLGTTLFALEIIHSYHDGYKFTKLSTEEVDEKGRQLQRIWARLGFETVSEDPVKGIEMKLTLSPSNITTLYTRHILPKH